MAKANLQYSNMNKGFQSKKKNCVRDKLERSYYCEVNVFEGVFARR